MELGGKYQSKNIDEVAAPWVIAYMDNYKQYCPWAFLLENTHPRNFKIPWENPQDRSPFPLLIAWSVSVFLESMVVEKLEIYAKVKLDQENNLKPMYLLIFHIVI